MLKNPLSIVTTFTMAAYLIGRQVHRLHCIFCSCGAVQAELEGLEHLAVELATRLVRRPQDLPSSVQQQILHYKEAMLTSLEVGGASLTL